MNNNWQHGFYRRTTAERQKIISQQRHLSEEQRGLLADHASALGNQLIENYLTDYQLSEGVAVGLKVNGHDYTVPMVVEEPSVIAAASNGAQRVARSGGFTASATQRRMIGQIILKDVDDLAALRSWVSQHHSEILATANAAHPSMQQRGGGAKDLRLRNEPPFVSLDLKVDVREAMGANCVNTMAEAVANLMRQQGWSVTAAILSNLATDSLQTVSARVDFRNLGGHGFSGVEAAHGIVDLSQLAHVDPYRAATHNKGIMNGIDAVMIAAGNDWRAIESGAHAYAAHDGQYRGLSTWQVEGQSLVGRMTVPLPTGIVGGSIGVNPQTRLNYQISGIQTAQELAQVAASVGLAQNLSALRALATNGIQAGHMKLQYRSLALSVGASPEEAPSLAKQLAQVKHVDKGIAKQLLEKMRKD